MLGQRTTTNPILKNASPLTDLLQELVTIREHIQDYENKLANLKRVEADLLSEVNVMREKEETTFEKMNLDDDITLLQNELNSKEKERSTEAIAADLQTLQEQKKFVSRQITTIRSTSENHDAEITQDVSDLPQLPEELMAYLYFWLLIGCSDIDELFQTVRHVRMIGKLATRVCEDDSGFMSSLRAFHGLTDTTNEFGLRAFKKAFENLANQSKQNACSLIMATPSTLNHINEFIYTLPTKAVFFRVREGKFAENLYYQHRNYNAVVRFPVDSDKLLEFDAAFDAGTEFKILSAEELKAITAIAGRVYPATIESQFIKLLARLFNHSEMHYRLITSKILSERNLGLQSRMAIFFGLLNRLIISFLNAEKIQFYINIMNCFLKEMPDFPQQYQVESWLTFLGETGQNELFQQFAEYYFQNASIPINTRVSVLLNLIKNHSGSNESGVCKLNIMWDFVSQGDLIYTPDENNYICTPTPEKNSLTIIGWATFICKLDREDLFLSFLSRYPSQVNNEFRNLLPTIIFESNAVNTLSTFVPMRITEDFNRCQTYANARESFEREKLKLLTTLIPYFNNREIAHSPLMIDTLVKSTDCENSDWLRKTVHRKDEENILIAACNTGSLDIVKQLVAYIKNVKTKKVILNSGIPRASAERAKKSTSEHETFTNPLIAAYTNGHRDIISYLLANGADLNQACLRELTLIAIRDNDRSLMQQVLRDVAKRKFNTAFFAFGIKTKREGKRGFETVPFIDFIMQNFFLKLQQKNIYNIREKVAKPKETFQELFNNETFIAIFLAKTNESVIQIFLPYYLHTANPETLRCLTHKLGVNRQVVLNEKPCTLLEAAIQLKLPVATLFLLRSGAKISALNLNMFCELIASLSSTDLLIDLLDELATKIDLQLLKKYVYTTTDNQKAPVYLQRFATSSQCSLVDLILRRYITYTFDYQTHCFVLKNEFKKDGFKQQLELIKILLKNDFSISNNAVSQMLLASSYDKELTSLLKSAGITPAQQNTNMMITPASPVSGQGLFGLSAKTKRTITDTPVKSNTPPLKYAKLGGDFH